MITKMMKQNQSYWSRMTAAIFFSFILSFIGTTDYFAFSRVPTKGISKALIVFVQFPDDPCNNLCCMDEETEWPRDRLKLPEWAQDTIDKNEKGNHTEGSITDYFCKMSRDRNDGKHGKFHLVGEVYPELIVMDSLTSTYLRGHYSENLFNANHEVIQKIKADPRGIDFSQYDCYKNGTDQYGEDGQIDMIIIWYRFFL